MALLVGAVASAPATADLVDPNVVLKYWWLSFEFERTAGEGETGEIGTFRIFAPEWAEMSAVLQNGAGTPIDRADIDNWGSATPFEVEFTGKVHYDGSGYSMVSTGGIDGLRATDVDTTDYAVEADFGSTSVAVDPHTGDLVITGWLSSLTGGDGSILVNRDELLGGDSWSFVGDPGDTPPIYDFDHTISVPAVASSYDNGSLWMMRAANGLFTLDDLFGSTFEGEDALEVIQMDVTIVPVPGALLLGILGLGAVVRMRRHVG